MAVEFHDRSPGCAPGKERVEHALEPLHPWEFKEGTAPALDRDNERYWLAFGRFIEANRLLHSVVFDDEVLPLQSIDDGALLIFNQRGNEDQIRARADGGFLSE